MRIIKQKFREEIFLEKFNGNYTKCAKAINVKPQQLHRFLNQDNSEAGANLLGGFLAYCEKEGVNFREYIFLSNDSTVVGSKGNQPPKLNSA